MATTNSTKQGSPRRLAELLDEQQEPFVLELYLLERGYRIRKNLELEGTIFGCCSIKHDYDKNLKKSISMKNSTPFSDMAKTLLSKLVSRKKPRKRGEKEVVGSTGRCSSFSCSTTLSNSTWPDSDADGEKTTHHDESAEDSVMGEWRFVEENKQCSPDSVLDEIDLLQGIPLYNATQAQEENNNRGKSRAEFQKKVTGDAIVSASLWELLMQFTGEKPKRKGRRKPFPEYMNSMKALQKDRQLVFDCVREAVENGNQLKSCFRDSREKSLKMEPAEFGKVVCKNLKVLRKLSVDEPNVKKVIKGDLQEGGAANEWNSFEVWKSDIVAEIGNGIVDEVTDEIIRDMID